MENPVDSQCSTKDRAIKKILQSIQKQGLISGQGIGSVDSKTVPGLSLTWVNTRAFYNPTYLSYILNNFTYGVFPLSAERSIERTLTDNLSFEEIQSRIQSSALFVVATEENIHYLQNDNSSEINMNHYDSAEVTCRPGAVIRPDAVIAPRHLLPLFQAEGFKKIYPVDMIAIPLEEIDLDMIAISMKQTETFKRTIQVPDYGKALKTLFEKDKDLQIFLHTTRFPCDFDFPAPISDNPINILQQSLFKPHPKGSGKIYYKNYKASAAASAEEHREDDMARLSTLRLFKLRKAETALETLSLIATIQ